MYVLLCERQVQRVSVTEHCVSVCMCPNPSSSLGFSFRNMKWVYPVVLGGSTTGLFGKNTKTE